MEERTYTQQEVDELKQKFRENRQQMLEVLIKTQTEQLQRIRAEHQEEIKKAEKRPFKTAVWGDQYDDWAENGWRENNGYVQTLLREAKAYLQQELHELEEDANCAAWKGIDQMHDGWYDYQWAVAAALKQVEANEATVENISFNGEGCY